MNQEDTVNLLNALQSNNAIELTVLRYYYDTSEKVLMQIERTDVTFYWIFPLKKQRLCYSILGIIEI